jgi:hypothetical protein
MQVEGTFKRLISEQLELVFNASATSLRLAYIDVLALLQDLLGGYSTVGNATVFREPEHAERLVYDALRELRAFKFSRGRRTSKLGLNVNASSVRIVSVKINSRLQAGSLRRGAKTFSGQSKDRWEPGVIRRFGRFEVFEKKQQEKELIDWAHREHYKNRAGTYLVRAIVDDNAGTLTINGREFQVGQFTYAHFSGALAIRPDESANASEAYDELMRNIGHRSFNRKPERNLVLMEGLKKALVAFASENVENGLRLQEKCEQTKKVQPELSEQVDQFLNDLLIEYQLLRKARPRRAAPPQISRRRTPTTTARRRALAR